LVGLKPTSVTDDVIEWLLRTKFLAALLLAHIDILAISLHKGDAIKLHVKMFH